MSQHFLLSSRARTLTLASVMRMGDEEVERVFIRLRWADNKGEPYCPHCGCLTVYGSRRRSALRWQCKAMRAVSAAARDWSRAVRKRVVVRSLARKLPSPIASIVILRLVPGLS